MLGIVPQFDELVREFSEQARLAMTRASDASPTPSGQYGNSGGQVIARYASMLATHHSQTLTTEYIDSMILDVSPSEDWLNSVDTRRPIFAEVTRRVDDTLGAETSNEVTYALRAAVLTEMGLGGPLVPQASGVGGHDQPPVFGPERFLDTEIVAIYW